MFDILFEGRLSVYLTLLLVIAVLFLIWKQRPGRVTGGLLLAAVFLAALLFLLDLVRETDREMAVTTLERIVEALNAGDVDAAFEPLADDFEAYDHDRDAARFATARAIRDHAIRNIQIKSLETIKQDHEKRTVTLRFNATAESNLSTSWNMLPIETDFVIDARGRARMITFRAYDPIQSESQINPFRH